MHTSTGERKSRLASLLKRECPDGLEDASVLRRRGGGTQYLEAALRGQRESARHIGRVLLQREAEQEAGHTERRPEVAQVEARGRRYHRTPAQPEQRLQDEREVLTVRTAVSIAAKALIAHLLNGRGDGRHDAQAQEQCEHHRRICGQR
eukprot:6214601-Pleurochrysis_carterae.AAC.3